MRWFDSSLMQHGLSYLHLGHVICDMSAVDELAKCLGIELFGISIISHETLLAVRDVDAAIQCPLCSQPIRVRHGFERPNLTRWHTQKDDFAL